MKNLVFILLLFTSTIYAQIEKKVGDFHKVTAFDQIDVLLIQGNENKVIIDGNEAEQVQLVNQNGELKIRMPFTKLMQGDDISVTVYFKKITAVEANEGSRIACETSIAAQDFSIIAKEGSQIKLSINVDKLTTRVANGSTISLRGQAKNQEIVVNSGGIYDAENLNSQVVTITGNAGGIADIYATEYVNAKVRAGGVITIYGKPKQIDQKIIAGGVIKETK